MDPSFFLICDFQLARKALDADNTPDDEEHRSRGKRQYLRFRKKVFRKQDRLHWNIYSSKSHSFVDFQKIKKISPFWSLLAFTPKNIKTDFKDKKDYKSFYNKIQLKKSRERVPNFEHFENICRDTAKALLFYKYFL